MTVKEFSVIMKRLCEKTGEQFSEYKYVKVLWSREELESCPKCGVVKESFSFFKKHPRVEEKDRKNE